MIKTNLFYTFIFINLFYSISFQKENENIFEDNIYLRENDQYILDINKFNPLQYSSLNFNSNNPNITLPGITLQDKEISNSQISYNNRNIQLVNNQIYLLQNDKKTIFKLKINEDGKINENLLILDQFLEEQKLSCSDMTSFQESLIFLCLKERIDNDQQTYVFINYDNLKQTIIFTQEFQTQYYPNPKIKLLKNNELITEETYQTWKFIIFPDFISKDSMNDSQFSLCELSYDSQLNEIQKVQVVLFYVKNLLFGGKNIKSIIQNIFVQNINQELFFVIYKEDKHSIKQWAYKCSFILDNSKIIKLVKCKTVFKEYIKLFFLKDDKIIYLDKRGQLFFCSNGINQCKSGQINSEWKIKKIFLIETVGVVIFEIDNKQLVIINDFQQNNFNWFVREGSKVKQYFLFQYIKNNQEITNLVEFVKNGYMIQDLTVQNKMKIISENIKEANKTEIYLDDKQLMKLDLIPFDNQIHNSNQNKTFLINRNQNKHYVLQTGWMGNELEFQNSDNSQVFYFDESEITFSFLSQIHKQFRIYEVKNGLILLTKDYINYLKCSSNIKKKIVTHCEQKFSLDINLDNLVKEVSQQSDWILISPVDNSPMIIYNLKKNHIKIYDVIENQKFCKSIENITYCVVKGQKHDNIKQMIHSQENWSENQQFDIKFKEVIKNIEKRHQDINVQQIRIFNVILDRANKQSLIIHFNIYSDSQIFNDIINIEISPENGKYDFLSYEHMLQQEQDSNIKTNSKIHLTDDRLVVITEEPIFKLFCYEQDSYYDFSFQDVKKLLKYKFSISQNEIVILYQSHQDLNFYIALLKITQNAIEQVIKREMVEEIQNQKNIENITELMQQLTEDLMINTMEITREILNVQVYNQQKQEIIHSFVYYRRGPYVITDDFQNGISIFDKKYYLEYEKDQSYNLTGYKEIQQAEFEKQEDETKLFIEDYYEILGNLKNISLQNQTDKIKINKPLEFVFFEEFQIYKEASSFTKLKDDYLIYQMKGFNQVTITKSNFHKVITFKGAQCQEITYFERTIFCLTNQDFYQILKYQNIHKPQEQFTLYSPGRNLKIIKIQNSLIFSMLDQNFNVIKIYQQEFDFTNTNEATIINVIGKNEFYQQNLTISEYFPYYNIVTDTLIVLVFDFQQNRLLIFSSQLKQIQNDLTIAKYIDLKRFDLNFQEVICDDKKSNQDEFQCTLISQNKIFVLEINKSLDIKQGIIQWNTKILYQFNNVIKLGDFSQTYYSVTQNEKYFIISGSNDQGSSVVVYRKNGSENTYFYLPLENGQIKDVKIEPEFLAVIIQQREQLKKFNYRIGNYEIQIENEFLKNEKQIFFKLEFLNDNQYDLHLTLIQNDAKGKIKKIRQQGILITLIVSNSLTFLFLLLLIALVIVMKIEKDKQRRISTNDIDESYDQSFRVSTYAL